MAGIFDPRVAIVVRLLDGQKHIEQLIDETGFGPSTIDRNVTVLEKAGLIKTEMEDKFPRRRFVSLTGKGRKVAEHLEEVRKILEGD